MIEQSWANDFAKEWIAEDKAGRPKYKALLERDKNHPIEKVGQELRKQMAWLKPDSAAATGKK